MQQPSSPAAESGTAAVPPGESERPTLGRIPTVAGGVPAIVSSMRHVLGQSGVVRGTRELLLLNQKRGFDCPGCAWPDPDDKRELTEFCENGAKAVAEETTTKRTTPEFFAQHSVAELAAWSDYDIGKSGRLTHPMWLRAGATHYEQISWDEAFQKIARELNALSSPNEAVFYTSGRTSNEAAFLYQLFVRMYGTNNLPDCSNMCHESSGVALKCGLAQATFASDETRANKVKWQELAASYDGIRDHISRVVDGFADYNKRVREPGGFYLPNAVRDAQEFHTSDRRAHFTVNPIPKLELKPDELLLMTIRSHDQFNTTIYGLSDRYRGVRHGRRVVFMNANDIEQRGLQASQWVDLISHHQGEQRRADRFMIVPYEIPPGSAAAYFPETNVLVPARSVVQGGSNTPTYKSIVITVQPSPVAEQTAW